MVGWGMLDPGGNKVSTSFRFTVDGLIISVGDAMRPGLSVCWGGGLGCHGLRPTPFLYYFENIHLRV